MIILDLDDTIFETKSMNHKVFEAPISIIENHYRQESIAKSKHIVEELWTIPIDNVFTKYQTPKNIIAKFYTEIDKVDYKELHINPFPDYSFIHEFKLPKILVTTGLKELQQAKIDALRIRDDFESIHIDDPRVNPRNDKFRIFKNILTHSKLHPQDIWVIGDNPESEINAAHKLGMKTIQRKSKSKAQSKIADYQIDTFAQLKEIIT